MLALLLDFINTNSKSERGSGTDQGDSPDLIALAFIARHLPTRVFFLTSDLPKIRQLLRIMNFPIYDSDITFVPDRDWASGMGWMPWASPIALYSLVRIQHSGDYSGSLGIVMAASAESDNESLVVAVVPRISYSTASPVRDSPLLHRSPSRKRQKVDHQTIDSKGRSTSKTNANASKPRACLFDIAHHTMHIGNKPPLIIHGVREDNTNEDDSLNSLADFFASQPKFRPVNLSVPNEYGQLIDNDGKKIIRTFRIDGRSLLWVSDYGCGKPTLPVYEFEHNFYWKGVLLMPIYHYSSINRAVTSYSKEELTPFVEANIFPGIFGPLLSQVHWKRGDKIVDVSHNEWADPTFQAIVFKVDEIMVQQRAVWATPIQLFRPDRQNQTWLSDIGFEQNIRQQQLVPQDLQTKIGNGRQECSMITHRLHLAVGDGVRVLAGQSQGLCGYVIALDHPHLRVLLHSAQSVNFTCPLDCNFMS